jgi:hypothetical protein
LYTEVWEEDMTYYPIDDCAYVKIKMPDGTYSSSGVYVYDLDRMAEAMELEKIEEDEDEGIYYVGYDAASINLRWDCGFSSCEQIRLSNRHKTAAEIERLVDSYLDNEHPLTYYLSVVPQ